jgi:Ring finger domain
VHVRENGTHEVDGCIFFAAEECPICLEIVAAGDDMMLLLCHHTLHAACLLPWLAAGKHTCPVCNRNLDELACLYEDELQIQHSSSRRSNRRCRRFAKANAVRAAFGLNINSSTTAQLSEQQLPHTHSD